ncbi:REP-associated tyrosine transposase [Calycomorphotria hydatis]|uniref:Transposase IS200 like protein n=1 Tax=Calycomorphotria hydatis TaxID=2528027 RepID=A0A517T7M8_9PLAN|nr:transposase [Calycomorphotria hydatis]QDT64375.1 Transposase IS200 like protein [Calycomorphotria hydatis]
MPHRKKVRHYNEPGHIHELTFSCYRRIQLLESPEHCRILSVAIQRAMLRNQFRLFAFVFMPEHVHLVVQPVGNGLIERLLFAIKRPSSFRIKQHLSKTDPLTLHQLTIQQRPGINTFRFWQEGPGYDRNLTEAGSIIAALDYVHANPVRRRLCDRPTDWKWTSARQFAGITDERDSDLPQIDPIPPDLID